MRNKLFMWGIIFALLAVISWVGTSFGNDENEGGVDFFTRGGG